MVPAISSTIERLWKQAHISFARTKIILARAIFDEIHGVRMRAV